MKFNQNDVLDAQLFMTAIVIINKRSFIRHVKDSFVLLQIVYIKEALKTIFLRYILHITYNLNFHCASADFKKFFSKLWEDDQSQS